MTGAEWASALDASMRRHGEEVTVEELIAVAETMYPEKWQGLRRHSEAAAAGFELRERRKLVQFLKESPVPVEFSWLEKWPPRYRPSSRSAPGAADTSRASTPL